MDCGDRMLLWCVGGPSIARAAVYPPPVEIDVGDGLYVLVDVGSPEQWHYEFIADSRHS